MRFKIALFILLIVASCHNEYLLSEEELQEPSATLTIITVEDNLPFSFRLPDGTQSGLYVEFWELWSTTNNIPIHFVMVPFREGLQLVKEKNTLHSGLFKNEQREQWADFSIPIHNVQTGIIYNRSIDKKSKLRELNNIKISTYSSSFQEFYIREHYPDIKLSTYENLDDAYNQLLNNNVDAVIDELPPARAKLAQMGLSGVFVISDEIITSNNVFGLIAQGQPELLARINAGIENIPVNEIIELEKKWLPTLKPFFSNHTSLTSLTLAERKWLQQLPSMSLGIDSTWYPYEYINDKGDYSGISADYIEYIKNTLALTIEVDKKYSWAESLAAIKNNEIDIIAAIAKTPDREKSMLFTDSYVSSSSVLVSRKNGFNANSLESLKGRSIGVIAEYAAIEFIATDYPEIIIIPVNSTIDGLKKLNDGQFDAFISDISTVNHLINKNQLFDLIITGFSPYEIDITMAVRTELEPLVGILNKVFLNMSDKEKAEIANNWLSVHVQTGTELSTIILWVLPIILFLLVIILTFFGMNRKFKELCLTDQLTGMRNRRFLHDNLKNDVDLVLRKNSKAKLNQKHEKKNESDLIFFLVDLDHFKQVNDIHGHKTGDAVLIQVKPILERVFRETDYLVRWGGEEFLVITRFSNRTKAPELAERLRQSVESHDFDIGQGVILKKTCSIGFACFPFLVNKPEHFVWEQVLDIADHCMFVAKKSNKNAWVGLNNINCSEENSLLNITEKTKELIKLKQLEVESSITDTSLLKWN